MVAGYDFAAEYLESSRDFAVLKRQITNLSLGVARLLGPGISFHTDHTPE